MTGSSLSVRARILIYFAEGLAAAQEDLQLGLRISSCASPCAVAMPLF